MILFVTNSFSMEYDTFSQPILCGTLNFASPNVVVNNTNTNENLFDKFESGTYPYIIITLQVFKNNWLQNILFAADDVNWLKFDNNMMFISQNAADGITLQFIR